MKREFYNRLNDILREFKQAEVAKAIGVSKAMISGYLAGKKMPGSERLYKIAQLAGVNVEWLISGLGPKYKNEPHRLDNEDLRIERRDKSKRKIASYRATSGRQQPAAVRKLLNLLENNPEMESVIEAYIDGLTVKIKMPRSPSASFRKRE